LSGQLDEALIDFRNVVINVASFGVLSTTFFFVDIVYTRNYKIYSKTECRAQFVYMYVLNDNRALQFSAEQPIWLTIVLTIIS